MPAISREAGHLNLPARDFFGKRFGVQNLSSARRVIAVELIIPMLLKADQGVRMLGFQVIVFRCRGVGQGHCYAVFGSLRGVRSHFLLRRRFFTGRNGKNKGILGRGNGWIGCFGFFYDACLYVVRHIVVIECDRAVRGNVSNDFVIAMFIFQLVPHGHTIAHEAIDQLILIGRFNFSLVRRFLGGSSFFNRVIFNRSSYRFLWVLFRGSSLFCCFDAGLLRCKHRLPFFPEQRIGSLLVGFHRIQRLSSDGIISVIRQRHLGKRLKRIKDGLHPFRVGQLCLYLPNAFLII